MTTSQMTIPEIHSFESMLAQAKKKFADAPKSAVIIGELNSDLKLAINKAVEYNLISAPQIVSGWEEAEPLLKDKKTDMLIGSNYEPYQLLSHLNDLDELFFNGNFISHIGLFKSKRYPKLLFVTDSFVQKQLDLKAKMNLLQNVVAFAHKLGISDPKAAFLAAVEAVYPQMVATTDAAIISKMVERKQIKGLFADGPLSFDIAIDQSAAVGKGINNSPVAGQADILIAPDIATANGIYKAATLLVKAQSGGILYGGLVPVAVNIPTDNSDNIFNSILLSVFAAG